MVPLLSSKQAALKTPQQSKNLPERRLPAPHASWAAGSHQPPDGSRGRRCECLRTLAITATTAVATQTAPTTTAKLAV